jgi:biopolymer transport protein ExbB/TolQ
MTTQSNDPNPTGHLLGNAGSLVVLCVTIVLIHAFYEFFVHPGAAAALQGGSEASRGFFVIIKDMEQEVCFIAMIWCSYLIVVSGWPLWRNSYEFPTGAAFWSKFTTDEQINWQQLLTELESSSAKDTPILQTWASCIRRFEHTKSVQNASDALQASVEALAVRLEAGNSMIRYLIWAIPSIGFIGTVRGIGLALSKADEALAGNIAGMTGSLGVAFNSTLVALFISIFLMALLHQLQRLQDGLLVKTQNHCEKHLLKHLH